MIGAISSKAQVQCVERSEVFFPDRLAGALFVKVVCDRVTYYKQLDLTFIFWIIGLLNLGDLLRVTVEPPGG